MVATIALKVRSTWREVESMVALAGGGDDTEAASVGVGECDQRGVGPAEMGGTVVGQCGQDTDEQGAHRELARPAGWA